MKESQAIKIVNEAIKELKADIEKGKSENFLKYLDWKAKFHTYSWHNSFLIMWQRDDATFVKGYKQWEEFGYHVNKGETGIRILAPMLVQYVERVVDGKIVRIFWKEMTEEERESDNKHKYLRGFKDVFVFDIKQTNCKEYPTFFVQMGNDYEVSYKSICAAFGNEGFKVVEEECKGQGFVSINKEDKTIHIKQSIDYNNKLTTLLHELGHKYLQEYEGEYSYKDGELQAESISYVVSKFIGLKNENSSDYIINWEGTIEKLKENIHIISEVSNKMMSILENCNIVELVS